MTPTRSTLTSTLLGLLVGTVGTWFTLNYTTKPVVIQLPPAVSSTAKLKVNYIPYQIETLMAVTTSHMNDERNPPFFINDPKTIAAIFQHIQQSPTSLSIQLNDGRIRARLTYGDTVFSSMQKAIASQAGLSRTKLSGVSYQSSSRQTPNHPLNSDPACIAFRSLSVFRFLGSVQRLGAGGAG